MLQWNRLQDQSSVFPKIHLLLCYDRSIPETVYFVVLKQHVVHIVLFAVTSATHLQYTHPAVHETVAVRQYNHATVVGCLGMVVLQLLRLILIASSMQVYIARYNYSRR